jgi:hypothetical protein
MITHPMVEECIAYACQHTDGNTNEGKSADAFAPPAVLLEDDRERGEAEIKSA